MITLDDFRNEERGYKLRSVSFQTVATFAGITNKKLFLRDGPTSNDGTMIKVPLSEDTAYQQVEHQLAHILFETNVMARDFFCHRFADLAMKAAAKHDIQIRPENIARLLYDFVVVLDSERVVGLWGQLYAGSEMLIREHLSESVAAHTNMLQTNVGAALLAHHLGYGLAPPFEDLAPIFDEAFEKVRFGTFAAVLLAARWLLKKVIDRDIEYRIQNPEPEGDSGEPDPNNPGDRAEALKELADLSTRQTARESAVDRSVPSTHPRAADKDAARAMAEDALTAQVEGKD